MAGLTRYCLHIEEERTEAKYIAHPSTWLNGDRWRDEYKSNKPAWVLEAEALDEKEKENKNDNP
jgi:hypothetical protein